MDVLEPLIDRIVPGTIIVFDEYIMNPHWMEDEYKEFQEIVQTYNILYEYLGMTIVTDQALIRIL